VVTPDFLFLVDCRKVNGKPLWRIRSSASCGPAMSRALANTSASQVCGAITVTLIQAEIAGSPVRGSIMWCRFFPACCQTRFVMVEVAMAPGSTFKVVRVFQAAGGLPKRPATVPCRLSVLARIVFGVNLRYEEQYQLFSSHLKMTLLVSACIFPTIQAYFKVNFEFLKQCDYWRETGIMQPYSCYSR